MDLRRPIKYIIGKDKITRTATLRVPIKDGSITVNSIKILPIIQIGRTNKESKRIVFDPVKVEHTDPIFCEFDNVTGAIAKLNSFAEMIYKELKNVIKLYLEIFELNEILIRNSKCKKLSSYDFEKDLTFGKSKNVFSCIFKTEKEFHTTFKLTKEQINYFTKLLDGYVIDRDCFTHGSLLFVYPDFKPILKAKPPNSEEYYIDLCRKTFDNNLANYNYIESMLRAMNEYLRKKKGNYYEI